MARRTLKPQLNQIRTWVGQGRTDAWIAHQLDVSVGELVGFAIGRSIWGDPLKQFLSGDLEREAAAEQIGHNYTRFVRVYQDAESAVSAG